MRNRAFNLLVRRANTSKNLLRAHFDSNNTLISIMDSEPLCSLLGHINLDRIMRARSEKKEAMDICRIVWVELLDKLPDNGYELHPGEADWRFRSNGKFKPVPVEDSLEEFRRLSAA